MNGDQPSDHGLYGRRAELAACLRATRGARTGLVVVRGATGSGRSALLHVVGCALRSRVELAAACIDGRLQGAAT